MSRQREPVSLMICLVSLKLQGCPCREVCEDGRMWLGAQDNIHVIAQTGGQGQVGKWTTQEP